MEKYNISKQYVCNYKLSRTIGKQRVKVLERTKHKFAIYNANIHAKQQSDSVYIVFKDNMRGEDFEIDTITIINNYKNEQQLFKNTTTSSSINKIEETSAIVFGNILKKSITDCDEQV